MPVRPNAPVPHTLPLPVMTEIVPPPSRHGGQMGFENNGLLDLSPRHVHFILLKSTYL
jgi:hypothetical protein